MGAHKLIQKLVAHKLKFLPDPRPGTWQVSLAPPQDLAALGRWAMLKVEP